MRDEDDEQEGRETGATGPRVGARKGRTLTGRTSTPSPPNASGGEIIPYRNRDKPAKRGLGCNGMGVKET